MHAVKLSQKIIPETNGLIILVRSVASILSRILKTNAFKGTIIIVICHKKYLNSIGFRSFLTSLSFWLHLFY